MTLVRYAGHSGLRENEWTHRGVEVCTGVGGTEVHCRNSENGTRVPNRPGKCSLACTSSPLSPPRGQVFCPGYINEAQLTVPWTAASRHFQPCKSSTYTPFLTTAFCSQRQTISCFCFSPECIQFITSLVFWLGIIWIMGHFLLVHRLLRGGVHVYLAFGISVAERLSGDHATKVHFCESSFNHVHQISYHSQFYQANFKFDFI